MKRNINERNVLIDGGKTDEGWCTVAGYEWGKDTDALKRWNLFLSMLRIYRHVDRFDILFLADLLWYTSEHEAIVDSVA